MRIRSIKPEFWGHPILAKLPADTQLMAIALISWSDDHGYFEADTRAIRGAVMPYRDDLATIDRDVEALAEVGFIEVRDADGRRVGRVVKFDLHQKVEKPKPSKLKEYFEAGLIPDSSPTNPRLIPDSSPTNPRRKGREGKGREGIRREVGGAASDASPTSRGPTRLGRVHAAFASNRDAKLTSPASVGGLEMPEAPPDEPPDWGRGAATLAEWSRLWPDLPEADADKRIELMGLEWLENSYWASTVRDGEPAVPYPWGAFLARKQWAPIAERLFGPEGGAA